MMMTWEEVAYTGAVWDLKCVVVVVVVDGHLGAAKAFGHKCMAVLGEMYNWVSWVGFVHPVCPGVLCTKKNLRQNDRTKRNATS
jgi:hypothetical protein